MGEGKHDLIPENIVDKMGWARMHHIVALDKRIGHGAYRLYSRILHYAMGKGVAWPGEERLAKELGCTTRTIRTWLIELMRAGLISRRRRFTNSSITIVHDINKVYKDHPLVQTFTKKLESQLAQEHIQLKDESAPTVQEVDFLNEGDVQEVDFRSFRKQASDKEELVNKNKREKKKKKGPLLTLWGSLLEELSLQLPKSTFNTWFRDSKPAGLDNGVMSIMVSTQQHVQLLNTKYVQMIMRNIKEKLASTEAPLEIDSIEFVVDPKS